MARISQFLVLFSLATAAAAASEPELIDSDGRRGENFFEFGNIVLYTAERPSSSDREPYWTDGRRGLLLRNVNTGFGSSSSDARDFTLLNGEVYFAANIGTSAEIWKTDGTFFGTRKVVDSGLNSGSWPDNNLYVYNNELYYRGRDPNNDEFRSELYKTNGTPGNFTLVKDINPDTGSSLPENFIEFKGELFFTAVDGDNDRELWKTDGTEGGTVRVANLNASGNSSPKQLTIMGDELFFTASDGVETQLWKTNGEVDNVTQVTTQPGTGFGLSPGELTLSGNQLFFTALETSTGKELYVSDGTAAGTRLVEDTYPGEQGARPAGLTPFNGGVIFQAIIDSTTNDTELAWSDGTIITTVANIAPDTSSFPSNFIPFRGEIYFTAFTIAEGTELWKTDGSEEGTQLVYETREGQSSDSIFEMFSTESLLYFVVNQDLYVLGEQQIDISSNLTPQIGEWDDNRDLEVTIQRRFGSEGTVSVNYDTSDITALAGEDYAAASGTLTWADGDASDRTINLMSLDDGIIEDEDESFRLTISKATAPATLGPNTEVVVTVSDENYAEVYVDYEDDLITTESGGTASVVVDLLARPSAEVSVTLYSDDETEGLVSPGELTFTPDNWNEPREVTITGVDDDEVDGNVEYSLVLDPLISLDKDFNGYDYGTETVYNVDNDSVQPTSIFISNDGPDPSLVTQPIMVEFDLGVDLRGIGATGTVTISDGKDSCEATLPETSCELVLNTLGERQLTASYSGDELFEPSTSGTESHQVDPATDVQVTKDNGVPGLTAGDDTEYVITVTNAGPLDTSGVDVTDNVPSEILNPEWTCTGAGGGVCSLDAGVGNIAETADLPVGASVVFRLSGQVDISLTEEVPVVNTATATGGSLPDPRPENNSATDFDPLDLVYFDGFELVTSPPDE